MRLQTIAAILAIGSPSAQAEWVHQKTDDPFQGDQHLAMTTDFSMSAGFRCTSEFDLALVFITPEKPDEATTAGLANVEKKLLVIIDDDPQVELEATLDETADRDNYRVIAEGPRVNPVAAAKANRRFAVAAQINGRIAFSKSFDVEGSTAAIGALLKGCGIGADQDDDTQKK